MEYSFDIVSKINFQEVTNAIDQAAREISNRYDFKGTKSQIQQEKEDVVILADDDYKLKSILEILLKRFASRGIPTKNLRYKQKEPAQGGCIRQRISIQQGIPQETAKQIVRLIKDNKFKVQASIQSDQVRVSSKAKDELQVVIAYLKNSNIDLDLQFVNYR
ncbi:MAG: YajQ family cyclic di-GMP-binding protein [bacterium]